jgi:hypothetical protein
MKFEIEPLVAEMLDYLPNSVWTSKTTTFLDPAFGGGQFIKEIERRLKSAGHSDSNIKSRVFGYEESDLHVRFAVNKHKLVGQYSKLSYPDFFNLDTTIKFDVIVGNPAYRDDSLGGQNKTYNQFAKKSLELLTPTGILAFITPTTVLRESKRFTLIGLPGLKVVDFKTNDHFPKVGVNVCSWVVDQSHSGDVTVISRDDVSQYPVGKSIYDLSEFDVEFIKIYEGLKNNTKKPEDRMFKQNPVDASISGRSKTPSADHLYPVFKIEDSGEVLVQYNRPIPKLHSKKKFVISVSKALNENSCIVSKSDFDVNHVFIDVKNQSEVLNIKSFILSNYFIEHSNKFKKLDGYGFNNSIKYLPPFDKTKFWTEEDVKAFIESYGT